MCIIQKCYLKEMIMEGFKQLKALVSIDKITYFIELLLFYYFIQVKPPIVHDCQWFLENAMLVPGDENTEDKFSILHYISPELYRYYLAWMLGTNCNSADDPSEISLRVFNPEMRELVGKTLVASSDTQLNLKLTDICKSRTKLV